MGLGIALTLFGACARIQMPTPTGADAARAGSRWPGTTVADLDRGRSLYVAHCSSCHQPVAPTRIPANEWPAHLEEMAERAHLSTEEASLVERYLVTMADER
jgi:mono/diheme cytochrome c family protein